MFGRTAALTEFKRQHNIFWPVRGSLWRVATFKSSLGAAQHFLACREALYAVLQNLKFTTLLTYFLNRKFTWGLPRFYRTRPIWFKSDPAEIVRLKCMPFSHFYMHPQSCFCVMNNNRKTGRYWQTVAAVGPEMGAAFSQFFAILHYQSQLYSWCTWIWQLPTDGLCFDVHQRVHWLHEIF